MSSPSLMKFPRSIDFENQCFIWTTMNEDEERRNLRYTAQQDQVFSAVVYFLGYFTENKNAQKSKTQNILLYFFTNVEAV